MRGVALGRVVVAVPQDKFRHARDGVHGRADLVAHIGEEVAFRLVGGLRALHGVNDVGHVHEDDVQSGDAAFLCRHAGDGDLPVDFLPGDDGAEQVRVHLRRGQGGLAFFQELGEVGFGQDARQRQPEGNAAPEFLGGKRFAEAEERVRGHDGAEPLVGQNQDVGAGLQELVGVEGLPHILFLDVGLGAERLVVGHAQHFVVLLQPSELAGKFFVFQLEIFLQIDGFRFHIITPVLHLRRWAARLTAPPWRR